MLKKSLSILLFLCLILFISNITYATGDVVMDLNTTTSTPNQSSSETVDNTVYTPSEDDTYTEEFSDFEYVTPSTSVTTDYDGTEDGLSIGNMINIILIVVGVVLILLGIAIILKLK